MALVKGEVSGREDVLVRVHSECLTGDVFHSLRCDCGEQLESALAMIEAEGEGVLLYLAQEGRGIGLLNKLKAYRLQEDGLDTVEANLQLGLPADLRDYGIGAQILADLGLSSIRILTNNPKKIKGLEGYGLSVSAQVPIEHAPNPHNEEYMRTKARRMGHTLHHQGLNLDAEMLHSERGRRSEERAPSGAEPEHRRAPAYAIAVGRFYEDLAERLVSGCARGVRAGRARGRRGVRRAGRIRAAAGRAVRRRVGPLCRRRLPGRGDQGRDRPLRLRLRRGRARGDAGAARHRRAVRVRRAHLRDDGAGARACRRGQARPGTPRRRGGAADGGAARRAARRAARSCPGRASAKLPGAMAKVCHSCGKGPAFGQSRSHSMVATKRRFDPNLQKVRILVGKAPRRVYVCTRCLKAGKVTKAL